MVNCRDKFVRGLGEGSFGGGKFPGTAQFSVVFRWFGSAKSFWGRESFPGLISSQFSVVFRWSGEGKVFWGRESFLGLPNSQRSSRYGYEVRLDRGKFLDFLDRTLTAKIITRENNKCFLFFSNSHIITSTYPCNKSKINSELLFSIFSIFSINV